MSTVAEGPLIRVRARVGSSRARPSGTVCTTSPARTTHTWVSGTRVMARRPPHGLPSRTMVPVSATAVTEPVTTAGDGVEVARCRGPVVPPGDGYAAQPLRRNARRGERLADSAVRQRCCDRLADLRVIVCHLDDGGAVVLEPVDELGDENRGAGRLLARCAGGAWHVDACGGVAQSPPDPGHDPLACGAHACSPRVRDHQSRKDSLGGAGRSRDAVHPLRGGEGSPHLPLRMPRRPVDTARPARANRPTSAMTQAAALIAAASGVGRVCVSAWASVCSARSWTNRSGMLILTGQTS